MARPFAASALLAIVGTMRRLPDLAPGLESFWEDADQNASAEHPLERELGDRLDALARYQHLIADARDNGRDAAADFLLRLHAREESVVRELTRAIRDMQDRRRQS